MKAENILNIAKNVFIEEANSLINTKDKLTNDFVSVINTIADKKHQKVIVCGIGKSAHIANKIVATLNSTGTSAQFLHASEAIHGDLGLITSGDIIIILSNSGNTPEIKNLVDLLKGMNHTIVAITAHEHSYLAKHATFVLPIAVDHEADPLHLVPTVSTTTQLAMGDALAVALMQYKNFGRADFARTHPGGALGKRLYWTVANLIDKTQLPLVDIDDKIKEAIISISKSRNGITAVEEQGLIVGVITDGDLRRMLVNHEDYHHLTIREIMTHNPKSVRSDILATEALDKIEQYRIGQLLVIDNDKYLGILDFQDLLREGII